jgi:aerobic-type carbon monoxide dehydrogenase small subunit (CoxS/CutS family)
MTAFSIVVNGTAYARELADSSLLLVDFLRDQLGLTGTHVGCNNGICGSCTVLMDNEPVRACLLLAVQTDGCQIVTIEGLTARGAELHPLQRAFVDHGAVQCGFCIPGMIMAAKALLDSQAHPTTEAIKAALEGNLCRCTGYTKIVEAVAAAAAGSRT